MKLEFRTKNTAYGMAHYLCIDTNAKTFGMDMHHIVSSKCTIKCCEEGGAYRRKSP